MPKQCPTRSSSKKRTGGQSRRKTGKEVSIGWASSAEHAIEHAELARRLVLASWPAIVQGLINKAMDGGYQQTKLLLELCALTNLDASQLNEQHKQELCDALLDGLGLVMGPRPDNGNGG
ncbi:MAG: hypothetical protein ACYDC6_15220 [Acidobacteriaceae bacterium]